MLHSVEWYDVALDRWTAAAPMLGPGRAFHAAVATDLLIRPPVSAVLVHLGDYIDLQAHGRDFYGIFSTNNTPDRANFPQGVRLL